MNKIFVLIDCNNFFVSCERFFNPKLREKPVCVLSNNDGCVVSRSQEVKDIGVPMGAPYFKYEKILKYHKVHVFSSNFSLYGDMSNRVMKTLAHFTPEIEFYSIDEAFLPFDGFEKRDLTEYGREIKRTVYKWTGIPVSVGIGSTKTLAKVGTERAKKELAFDGVCNLLAESDIDKELEKLPVSDVWGVGRRYTAMLKGFGINTARDLKYQKDEWIKRKMTIAGLNMVHELRGKPRFELSETPEPKKQILCSRSFGKKVAELKKLKEAAATHATHAAEKLREQHSVAEMVSVFVATGKHEKNFRYSNVATVPLSEPTADSREIIKAAVTGLEQIYKKGYWYKKVGVFLTRLSFDTPMQQTLFAKDHYGKKKRNLMKAIDSINNEFGSDTMQFAASGTHKSWKGKSEKKSKRYTTRWDELLVAKG
ncbi:Y-family DNA polymerase [Patescibacteria group bacterium]|nr:Y-family DNA polymerase [Patescibacteria group bacterium]